MKMAGAREFEPPAAWSQTRLEALCGRSYRLAALLYGRCSIVVSAVSPAFVLRLFAASWKSPVYGKGSVPSESNVHAASSMAMTTRLPRIAGAACIFSGLVSWFGFSIRCTTVSRNLRRRASSDWLMPSSRFAQ